MIRVITLFLFYILLEKKFCCLQKTLSNRMMLSKQEFIVNRLNCNWIILFSCCLPSTIWLDALEFHGTSRKHWPPILCKCSICTFMAYEVCKHCRIQIYNPLTRVINFFCSYTCTPWSQKKESILLFNYLESQTYQAFFNQMSMVKNTLISYDANIL